MPVGKTNIDRMWPAKLVGQHPYRPWLQARGSLTAHLKACDADFAVQPVRQGWYQAHFDEYALLGEHVNQRVWLREVWLLGSGKPRVFAHSVICKQGLRGKWQVLRKLGNHPLGAALFADARVQRGKLHYQKLAKHHPLFRAVLRQQPHLLATSLWARRSLFRLGKYALLVTEVFMPELPKLSAPSLNPRFSMRR